MERRPRGRQAGRPEPILSADRDWLAHAVEDAGRPSGNKPEVTISRSIDALVKAAVGIGVELRNLREDLSELQETMTLLQAEQTTMLAQIGAGRSVGGQAHADRVEARAAEKLDL